MAQVRTNLHNICLKADALTNIYTVNIATSNFVYLQRRRTRNVQTCTLDCFNSQIVFLTIFQFHGKTTVHVCET